MRSSRVERLYNLCWILGERPAKNRELRPLYDSPYKLESDCIELYKKGIVELKGGLKDRRGEVITLKKPVTVEDLEKLFSVKREESDTEYTDMDVMLEDMGCRG